MTYEVKNGVKRQNRRYTTVDLNYTYYPVAFCSYHNGWLTQKLMALHKCEKRNCRCLERMDEES